MIQKGLAFLRERSGSVTVPGAIARLGSCPAGLLATAGLRWWRRHSPWLSPEQAEQYNSYKYFEVIGSDTGKRYRIRHGRMMNIDELDSVGNKVCEWCFLPQGNLATGDVMLAQKITLETCDGGAGTAVRGRPTDWRESSTEGWPQTLAGSSSIPPGNRSAPTARLEPVSVGHRTSLCQHREFLPGKRLPRPETGAAFSATLAVCARQRQRCSASAAAKPRKVKDFSDSRTKAALCGTVWWGWQDSNWCSRDYGTRANPRRWSFDRCSEPSAVRTAIPSIWHRLRQRRHGGIVRTRAVNASRRIRAYVVPAVALCGGTHRSTLLRKLPRRRRTKEVLAEWGRNVSLQECVKPTDQSWFFTFPKVKAV
jgi:hypothetical protein